MDCWRLRHCAGTALIFAMATSLAWAGPYETGKAAYQKGDYATAQRQLVQAVAQDHKNAEKAFYLGLTHARLKHYKEAQAQFEQVLKLTPPGSPLAQKAQKNMGLLTQVQMVNYSGNTRNVQTVKQAQTSGGGNNYLAQALHDGKVMHWDPKKMPLRVFITSGTGVPGWTPTMKSLVTTGMQAWQNATYNQVRFIQTTDPQKADIIVRWKKQLAHNRVGENPFEYVGSTITRSDVTIATHTPDGNPMPLSEIQKTATHELGHAIGIQGHSPNPSDIMYYSVNPAQNGSLSMRDTTTIRMLYKMDADIKNDSNMSLAQSRQFYDLVGDGLKSHQNQSPAQALIKYREALKLNPNDAMLYHNMGVAYAQLKQDAEAMNAFRKAVQLDKNRVESRYALARLVMDRGVSRARSNQLSAARSDFQEAVQLLEQVSASPAAPSDAKKNLAIARKNLTLTSVF